MTFRDRIPAETYRRIMRQVLFGLAIVLVVFIFQNTASQEIKFLGFESEPPLWVSLLLAAVLGAERVPIHSNFFDLGGHSLLVIQAIEATRERTGIAMPAREYMMQSLRQIAALYDDEANAHLARPQRHPYGTDFAEAV